MGRTHNLHMGARGNYGPISTTLPELSIISVYKQVEIQVGLCGKLACWPIFKLSQEDGKKIYICILIYICIRVRIIQNLSL